MRAERSRPFDGLLVLDFTQFISGPLATTYLADHGARVIRIEPPGGDPLRSMGVDHARRPDLYGPTQSALMSLYGRGKESVVLDLKRADDVALVRRIAARADVLVENFRPGVMARLGLDAEVLRAGNPRLVYVSVSGFGQTGAWADHPAFDVVVQATSGFMRATGHPGGEPTKAGASISDANAAVHAFGACAMALYAREQTGEGAHIDIGMQDAMLLLQGDQVTQALVTGTDPGLRGNDSPMIHPFGVFRCQGDGRIALCIGSSAQLAALSRAMGHPEWADDPRFGFPEPLASTHREAFDAEFEATLATRPAEVWIEIFEAAEVPAAQLRDFTEVAVDPDLKARGTIVELGGHLALGTPIKLGAGFDTGAHLVEPADLGAHTEAVRREFAGG